MKRTGPKVKTQQMDAIEQLRAYKKEIDNTVPLTADELEQFRIRFLGSKNVLKPLFLKYKISRRISVRDLVSKSMQSNNWPKKCIKDRNYIFPKPNRRMQSN